MRSKANQSSDKIILQQYISTLKCVEYYFMKNEYIAIYTDDQYYYTVYEGEGELGITIYDTIEDARAEFERIKSDMITDEEYIQSMI